MKHRAMSGHEGGGATCGSARFIVRANARISLGSALQDAGRYSDAEEIILHSLADLQGLPAQTRGTDLFAAWTAFRQADDDGDRLEDLPLNRLMSWICPA
jgi:hypothetical protein